LRAEDIDGDRLLYKFAKKGPNDNDFRICQPYSSDQNWKWTPNQSEIGYNNISVSVIDKYHANLSEYDDIIYCNYTINPKPRSSQQTPVQTTNLQFSNPFGEPSIRNEMKSIRELFELALSEAEYSSRHPSRSQDRTESSYQCEIQGTGVTQDQSKVSEAQGTGVTQDQSEVSEAQGTGVTKGHSRVPGQGETGNPTSNIISSSITSTAFTT
jgi:hypothetical protein